MLAPNHDWDTLSQNPSVVSRCKLSLGLVTSTLLQSHYERDKYRYQTPLNPQVKSKLVSMLIFALTLESFPHKCQSTKKMSFS